MPIKIAFLGPLSLPSEALLFSYLLWAERDCKKGSDKGMKCPEGWRGEEEKQEQVPCVWENRQKKGKRERVESRLEWKKCSGAEYFREQEERHLKRKGPQEKKKKRYRKSV